MKEAATRQHYPGDISEQFSLIGPLLERASCLEFDYRPECLPPAVDGETIANCRSN